MSETGHAFISYVRENKDQVDRLQTVLEAAGVPVWRDTRDLWPGQDWRLEIRTAITDGSLAFIACFSRVAAAKERSYQREELLLAVEQLRVRSPEQAWFMPVRLDDCALPHYDLGAGRSLDSLQRTDLFGAGWKVRAQRLASTVVRMLQGGSSRGTSIVPGHSLITARSEPYHASLLPEKIRQALMESRRRDDQDWRHSHHPPPAEELLTFPALELLPTAHLYRVTTSGFGPWWFNSMPSDSLRRPISRDERINFDLPEPAGTCYLALDPLVALLEVLGGIRNAFSEYWLRRFTLWTLSVPEVVRLADLTSRLARPFGVVGPSMNPAYVVESGPEWAVAFAAAGFDGILFRSSFDPAGGACIALFGPYGERRRWRKGRGANLENLIERLQNETGMRAAPLPDDLGELLED